MNKNILAFDIDGVITNTHYSLNNQVKIDYGVDWIQTIKDGFVDSLPGIPQPIFKDYIDTFIVNQADDIPLLLGSIKALKKYYEYIDGEPITIVTARGKKTHDTTRKYFKKNFPDLKFNIIFEYDKIKFLKNSQFKFFVEDQVDHVENLQPVMGGIFIYNQIWNTHYCIKNNNVRRIDTLEEAVDIIIHFNKILNKDELMKNFDYKSAGQIRNIV